ncbi:hypothetical protein ES703_104363 [subsurface metagenome]
MYNFEYQNSTRIVFGKGEVSKVGEVVRPFGSNILLVTGKESEAGWRKKGLLLWISMEFSPIPCFQGSMTASG